MSVSRQYLIELPRAEIAGTYRYMDIETKRIVRDVISTLAIVLLTLRLGSSSTVPWAIVGIGVVNSLEVRDVFGAWREYRREKAYKRKQEQ